MSWQCAQYTGPLALAARAWAAAAGAAGAYAPDAIADALLDSAGDIVRAVSLGTARAVQQHNAEEGGGPAPRGCDVAFDRGTAVAVVWRTTTHEIRLGPCGEDTWFVLALHADADATAANAAHTHLIRPTTPGKTYREICGHVCAGCYRADALRRALSDAVAEETEVRS